jgi:hypothetical protein
LFSKLLLVRYHNLKNWRRIRICCNTWEFPNILPTIIMIGDTITPQKSDGGDAVLVLVVVLMWHSFYTIIFLLHERFLSNLAKEWRKWLLIL